MYKLFWDDFCAWYLEAIKPSFGDKMDTQTYEATLSFFESLLKMIHPIMPFISEELWQNIEERSAGQTIMFEQIPAFGEIDEQLLKDFDAATQVVMNVRNIRQSKGISPKDALEVFAKAPYNPAMDAVIKKLANVSQINAVEAFDAQAQGVNFMIRTSEFFIQLNEHINVEEEIAKMKAEIEYYEKFLKQVNAKLSNEKFVNNAPEAVVALERKKQSDATTKLENLNNRIASLLNK
jgi:valyl-tRNA synthetase